jgi:hypothetical protein
VADTWKLLANSRERLHIWLTDGQNLDQDLARLGHLELQVNNSERIVGFLPQSGLVSLWQGFHLELVLMALGRRKSNLKKKPDRMKVLGKRQRWL